MKSSVVIATYNGERYIIRQLESVLRQSLQADEVIILDDRSTDHTVEIVEDFINRHGLESSWHIYINPQNLGVTQNFVKGSMDAKGDIVFYSDQDDIWEKDKIESMMGVFEDRPDAMACYCLRRYIDENDQPIKMRFDFILNPPKRFREFQKVSVREAVRYNKSPGLCLALRKDLAVELGPFILSHQLTHDLPVGTVAAIKGGYYVVNKKLVRYRIHSSNASSPHLTVASRVSSIERQVKGRMSRLRQMQAVKESYGELLKPQDYARLDDAIAHTSFSIAYLENLNAFGLIRQCFHLNRMINRWISINNVAICLKYIIEKRELTSKR